MSKSSTELAGELIAVLEKEKADFETGMQAVFLAAGSLASLAGATKEDPCSFSAIKDNSTMYVVAYVEENQGDNQ